MSTTNKYLVELLLREPDIVLRLLGGPRLVAQLVPRLGKNLSTRHHFHSTLQPPLFIFCLLLVNKQEYGHCKHSHSLTPS